MSLPILFSWWQETHEKILSLSTLKTLSENVQTTIHVAVMKKPYLSLIKEHKKTIESRLSRVRQPPFEKVQAGDLILWKQASGAIVGVSSVTKTEYVICSNETTLRQTLACEAEKLCLSLDFIEQKKAARFVSFIHLSPFKALPPKGLQKRDQRGWVVISPY